MAYDQKLADRLRERFSELPNVEEKAMFGGYVIMYNGKMCAGVVGDELMIRVDHSLHDTLKERPGCRTMAFKKPMPGYVLVEQHAIKRKDDFEYYIQLALDFNPMAKASKKK